MNKRDLFEQKIKNAVGDFEAPMDVSAWNKIEQQLPVGSAKTIGSIKGWIAGILVVAATATGFWYFTRPSIKENIDSYQKEKIEQFDKKSITNEGLEKPIIIKEKQPFESIDNKSSQEDVEFDNKKSIVNSDDSEDIEPADPILEEDIVGKEVITDKPEQTNLESLDDVENLKVNWIISKNVLCQGEELMVSINNVNEPVELIWDFGDGKTSNEPENYHQYIEPGTYIIKLKANSLISDKKVYREKKYIEVKAKPQASFTIVKNDDMSAFPEVEFKNLTTYYNHIEWNFQDINIENKNTIEKFYRYKGRYQVGLIVTNHFGCKDSVYKDLVIEEDYKLLAPDSFTPNGDGINDTFIPEALTFLNKNFSMQVIDTKNGGIVFETQNIESPWNGMHYTSGALLNAGLYAWTVKFEDGSVYSGSVKLITE